MFKFLLESLKACEVTSFFGERLKGQYGGKIPRLFLCLDVRDIHLYVIWELHEGQWTLDQHSLDRDILKLEHYKRGHSVFLTMDDETLDEWLMNHMDTIDDLSSERSCLEIVDFFGEPDNIKEAENLIKVIPFNEPIEINTNLYSDRSGGVDGGAISDDIMMVLCDVLGDQYSVDVRVGITPNDKEVNQEPIGSYNMHSIRGVN